MKLTIRKCDNLSDNFLIERAEHDGREWEERPAIGIVRCCKSARLCGVGGFSADIEGTAAEMLAIARAIRMRTEVTFKRCSVDATTWPVLFGSPRNDNGQHGDASRAEADDLADQIEALLSGR